MKSLLSNRRRPCICVLVLFATLAVHGALAGNGRAQSEGVAYSAELKGEIDLAKKRELELMIGNARKKGARLVIVRLDSQVERWKPRGQ